MKVILTGTTGFVGAEVLRQSLLHPSISNLVVLSRRPLTPAITNPKLKVIILKDFTSYPPHVIDELKGAEACIWALGIKTSDVAAQRKVAIDYTLAAADAFKNLPTSPSVPFRFIFTSGLLAIRDQNANALFMGPARRVKGEAETEILTFAAQAENQDKIAAVVTRPGLVHGPGRTTTSVVMAGLPASLSGIKVTELAAVSVDLAVNEKKCGGQILDNAELAAKGKALLEAEPGTRRCRA